MNRSVEQSAARPSFALAKIPATGSAALLLFASSLFLSALLLFTVQPMFAKLVLPKLGGSSAVWSIALVFFQAVLLLGYAYAHVLASYLTQRTAALVHLLVLALALLALPVSYPEAWSNPPEHGTAMWVAALFAAGVGLPFFAVSATAPLLQSWFSKTGHVHAADPYFLYGASNAGSFVALLLYPFAIEPLMALSTQAAVWKMGYMALCGLIMVCGTGIASLSLSRESEEPAQPYNPTGLWRERAIWTGLAFVPSGLLVAVTAHVTADIVAAPFLWVLPLALYLLTFVLVFARKPVIGQKRVAWLHTFIFAPFVITLFSSLSALILVPCHLVMFFIAVMLCHGELAARRPEARRLTEFYLFMSFGGVLGGVFASLLAPNLFASVYEYPILLAATFLCRPEWWTEIKAPSPKILWTFGVALLLIALPTFITLPHWTVTPENTRFGIAAAVLLTFFTRASLVTQAGAVICGLVIVNCYGLNQLIIERARSFYGTHTVMSMNEGLNHLLVHGTTIHGVQERPGGTDAPQSRPRPLAYYFPEGAIGVAVATARAQHPIERVGAIGLGSGASACLGHPAEFWRFFEIDPEVVRIARDKKLFSYLADCGTPHDVILGDGRLMLARENDASFDLLLLDAFSSDSIPTHLLTADAIKLYVNKLKPGGALVIHISNVYMDLAPAVSAAAASQGLVALISAPDPRPWPAKVENYKMPSKVAVIVRNESEAAPYLANGRFARFDPAGLPEVWTDDYSNTLDAMWRQLTGATSR